MKKVLIILTSIILLSSISYFSFLYFAHYSEGTRSGQLIKFSRKGVVFKTWEGELSQGISGSQIFSFSVAKKDTQLIETIKELEGSFVKVTYIERYKTFPWWGDTKYFVTEIKKIDTPYRSK